MNKTTFESNISLKQYLKSFTLIEDDNKSQIDDNNTIVEFIKVNNRTYQKFINEYWTSQQRKASSLHEISYRACFKAQLPHFFINLLSKEQDVVYDPFSGRGTTIIEAALSGRNIIANDINPLSTILSSPRLTIPELKDLEARLNKIRFNNNAKADLDLSMFYHPKTESEIVSLKKYLNKRKSSGEEDCLDHWIRMIATNRLTGHSSGFFSVYTLPPNQAVSPERQKKINEKRNQKPSYRNIRKLIIKKTKSLIKNLSEQQTAQLNDISKEALFLTKDARKTHEIPDNFVQLTVTSPPFLNVVQYTVDNWLRCWFNCIDVRKVDGKITMSRTLEEWTHVMSDVFKELYRITKKGGWVAFEVGEVRNGKIKLDEHVIPLGANAGFSCEGILINKQAFTKTSNIWGVKNNSKGTNTNRIVIFYKR